MATLQLGLRVAVEVAKNIGMGVPVIRSARVRRGRTARPPQPSQLGHQVYKLFDLVKKHAGSLEGKSVLEIGPGDNIAIGLAFLASGARSYTALDRFPGDYGGQAAKAWYRLVRQEWQGPWPTHLDAEAFPSGAPVNVIPHSVERASAIGKFDIVCSHAVGEVFSWPGLAAQGVRQRVGCRQGWLPLGGLPTPMPTGTACDSAGIRRVRCDSGGSPLS